MEPVSILILGEFDPRSETHLATDLGLTHAAESLRVPLRTVWRSTADVQRNDVLEHRVPPRLLQQQIRAGRDRDLDAVAAGFANS